MPEPDLNRTTATLHDLTPSPNLQWAYLRSFKSFIDSLTLRATGLSHAERMFTKHVFNDSDLDDLVQVSLRGAVSLNPSLRLHRETKTVYTVHPSPSAQVAVIAGGGAGHEPAHAGYTGNGMLTASVSGEMFASPSASQILTAIRLAVHTMKKSIDQSVVLLIVNNYTGDRLNFGLAAERARVLGIAVDIVVGADDVSLLASSSHPDSTERYEEPRAGPRGLAAKILVFKILGAAAASGSTLQELKILGDAVTRSLKSVGVGLAHCHVPRRSGDRNAGESQDADKLGKDECEIGIGLNNEPGARREVIGSAEYLVKRMVKMVVDNLPQDERSEDDRRGDNEHDSIRDVVLFINNLGGMSTLEMDGVVDHTIRQLASSRIHPVRVYMAPFMTCLNTPGFSISILDLNHVKSQGLSAYADVLNLLDMPTDATAWVGVRQYWPDSRSEGPKRRNIDAEVVEADKIVKTFAGETKAIAMGRPLVTCEEVLEKWRQVGAEPHNVDNAVREACKKVFAVERDLTHFDTVAGDGDCGETFAAGASAISRALDHGELSAKQLDPEAFIAKCGELCEGSMGGTCGALFGIYLTALSSSLHNNNFRVGCSEALIALRRYTPAERGDRTIIDSLQPFCESLVKGASLEDAANAATTGAEKTRGMKARLGRASYVREGNIVDVPDPGAWGVASVIDGFVCGLSR